MKILEMEMPLVGNCKAENCAYNRNQLCHARAITVGDGINPRCDTFLISGQHTQASQSAGVGACKIASCKHNEDWECQADTIQIQQGECVSCMTFCKR